MGNIGCSVSGNDLYLTSSGFICENYFVFKLCNMSLVCLHVAWKCNIEPLEWQGSTFWEICFFFCFPAESYVRGLISL